MDRNNVPGTLIYDLTQAEKHLGYALENVYHPGGERRGFFFRRALLRAQSLTMSLLVKELQRPDGSPGEIEP